MDSEVMNLKKLVTQLIKCLHSEGIFGTLVSGQFIGVLFDTV